MLPVSQEFLRAVGGSHERLLTTTVRLPDNATGTLGEEITFPTDGCTVKAAFVNGKRYEATFSVTPDGSREWSDLLLTPGALFRAEVALRTSGGSYEPVDLFTGELSAAPTVSVFGDAFSLTCQDQWQRIVRSRFTSPYTSPAGARAGTITALVTAAVPTAAVITPVGFTGGTHAGGVVYDKDRDKVITDLATEADPDLAVGFNASGDFLIDTQPIIDVSAADYTVRQGERGTLIDFQRIKEVTRLYNTVVIRPAADTQTWDQVIVEITDVTHPRHKNKIGVVPFFYASPLPTDHFSARQIARQILQQIIREQSSGRIVAVDNPALEPGDIIAAEMTTGPDSGQIIPALVTSISRNVRAGTMELETQQDAEVTIEEATT